MKRNYLIYIGFVAAAAVGISACSQAILDLKPLDSYSEVDVFSDQALLTDFVNGTYRGMRQPFDDENSLLDGLTDNAYNQHGSAASVNAYNRGEVIRDNGEGVTRNLWANAYSNIRRVNLFLEKTTGSTAIPATALTQLTGEMQFLRAYLYADLMRWYGGVPLITNTFVLGEGNTDVARNTADEIAAFVVKECDEAMTKLGSAPAVARGRATKEAAMALKARTLLYAASPLFNTGNDQSRWTTARDANKAVMDLTTFPLITSATQYGQIFNGRSTAEIIFARNFTPNNAHGNGSWGVNLWLYSNGLGGWSNTTPTQNLVDSYEMANGKPITDPTSGYNNQTPYVNRDPRLASSVLYEGATIVDPTRGTTRAMQYFRDKAEPNNTAKAGLDSRNGPSAANASRTGYNWRKFLDEGKRADASGDQENTSPWIYFRRTEFYLNYAEAQLALGNEAEARTAINAVRARVGMPAITETGAALVQRYRNERRVELVLEDHRFFDIRRWKIGPEAFNKPATGVDVYRNGTTTEYVYNYTADNSRKWDDKMYFLPIPYTEIQRSNGKLTQNPGY
ncbi:RagB/SusD family nutrient uptake outer membrane protein [Fibrella sp. ES10-3-2-2]|nr:hypothetical protein A6C57_22420 [Fibrella sp. ES10-3-2-2]